MLSDKEKAYFHSVADEIIDNDVFQSMRQYYQHGSTSVFKHVISTSLLCYEYALKHKSRVDYRSLIRGALLHDLFLYDWHIVQGRKRLHGFRHPQIALENARKYFTLNKIEENMIRCHMYPLTIFHVPRYKETWILTLMDKKETLTEMRKKRK